MSDRSIGFHEKQNRTISPFLWLKTGSYESIPAIDAYKKY